MMMCPVLSRNTSGTGGFRLTEGTLKGRLSQIKDINGTSGVDVVYIRAEVEKGVLEVARSAPVFHDISGVLELKKRVFSLKKMNGRFGNSPFKLDGHISDFARPEKYLYRIAKCSRHGVKCSGFWEKGEIP